MDGDGLKERLPPSVAERVQTAIVKDGRATLVLDARGMAGQQRADLEAAVRDMVLAMEEVDEVNIGLTAERNKPKILAIGSGKGGVGKSTLSANLAVALAKMGRKVGLVDADIYGPSQPKLLGNEKKKPYASEDRLVPVPSAFGVNVLSMGHIVEAGRALVWRGPMAGNAMGQLVDAHWNEEELLIIDLPPGTGDVQLTMLQKHKPAGAVIVSTPQDLALIDAQRAAQMFEEGKVPLVGLVENMAGYACPHCGEVSDPFGRGAVEDVSQETGIPFLGRIPLAMDIRSASDAGQPPAAGDGPEGEAFAAIAVKLAQWLDSLGAGEAA